MAVGQSPASSAAMWNVIVFELVGRLQPLVRRWGTDEPALGAVQWPYIASKEPRMATTETRRRTRRLELRTTPDERDLIERAVAATGTDLTKFIVLNAVDAARRVLADRDRFDLDDAAVSAWDALNAREARPLPGLRRLMDRPSPFAE
ncbi:MAG: type II toxin-antitoxin system TacA family antitoxin [Acidimicrobiales bacterium]